ncbi:ATP-binding cassette domain-containing protein [Pseudoalteromonas sp. JC28]|uniref:AAA family ATPase n=1 Tax=Pseudoalteromonas sp. JC28 TaxID=2267617 RepID=UPI0015731670|nr:AAA family ATPase [Pseudoalteromonas sp. JC28]NSY32670.1 ATP-binding cassette domain-containing protein [Pseudoalteromonas sp. JC28]
MKKLVLPRENDNEEIETSQSLLLIGANGSGKTRLGTWIEITSPQKDSVHRISAQKSLALPDSITPQSIELAEKDLLFGNPKWSYHHKSYKFKEKPATQPLNDYQKLMVYLFSDETEENAKFKRECKANDGRVEPPVTKIDRVKELWEEILPHRELIIGGLRTQTCVKGHEDKLYNSSEMSDGERVIFYLIGQCLAAPQNGIIVIDEPELHLHKSIQAPLWDAIEKQREDCLFVYLTHDVDFAAAKSAAKMVWLKSFDGSKWEWEQINQDEDLPGDLLIEVLGSRKPVVLVEGENGSYDVSLYRELLPNFLVIPRGSCTQVIQSVKALKANPQIHHLEVYGVIDRDRRIKQMTPITISIKAKKMK